MALKAHLRTISTIFCLISVVLLNIPFLFAFNIAHAGGIDNASTAMEITGIITDIPHGTLATLDITKGLVSLNSSYCRSANDNGFDLLVKANDGDTLNFIINEKDTGYHLQYKTGSYVKVELHYPGMPTATATVTVTPRPTDSTTGDRVIVTHNAVTQTPYTPTYFIETSTPRPKPTLTPTPTAVVTPSPIPQQQGIPLWVAATGIAIVAIVAGLLLYWWRR